jgi:hypothetical protein
MGFRPSLDRVQRPKSRDRIQEHKLKRYVPNRNPRPSGGVVDLYSGRCVANRYSLIFYYFLCGDSTCSIQQIHLDIRLSCLWTLPFDAISGSRCRTASRAVLPVLSLGLMPTTVNGQPWRILWMTVAGWANDVEGAGGVTTWRWVARRQYAATVLTHTTPLPS